VTYHAGKPYSVDREQYSYLQQTVVQSTGDAKLVLETTVQGHRRAVSESKGLAACLNAESVALYAPFVKEMRERMLI